MSLSDDLANLSRRCATCEWCKTRTSAERKLINEQVLELRALPRQECYGRYADLLDVCAQHGLETDPGAFRHHCRTHVAE